MVVAESPASPAVAFRVEAPDGLGSLLGKGASLAGLKLSRTPAFFAAGVPSGFGVDFEPEGVPALFRVDEPEAEAAGVALDFGLGDAAGVLFFFGVEATPALLPLFFGVAGLASSSSSSALPEVFEDLASFDFELLVCAAACAKKKIAQSATRLSLPVMEFIGGPSRRTRQTPREK